MTQKEKILAHLYEFGSITPLEALMEYSCMRLASRMADLKADGVPFYVETVKSKNHNGEPVHYARYILGRRYVH